MRDESLSAIGRRIHDIRKEKGMSLKDLALSSQVTPGLLSKIENFRAIPSLPVLFSISNGLGVGMGELVKDLNHAQEGGMQVFRSQQAERQPQTEGLLGLLSETLARIDTRKVGLVLERHQIEAQKQAHIPSQEGFHLILVTQGEVHINTLNENQALQTGDCVWAPAAKSYQITATHSAQVYQLVLRQYDF